MQEITPDTIEKWKAVYEEYKTQLKPNRKTAEQLIEYLKQKYPVKEITDNRLKQVVTENFLQNDCFAEKLPADKKPEAIGFAIQNTGAGKALYEKQDVQFKGESIVVGIELVTGYFTVEGSSMLWDELFAYRGLDLMDLKNFYLVAEYINCLKKFEITGKPENTTQMSDQK
jgi:hypothetical protein